MNPVISTHPLSKKVFYGQVLTFLLYASLILVFVYWAAVRSIGFHAGILFLQILPLLAVLPGMLKKVYRSYSWLCFIVLFYFIFAVQLVLSERRETSDFIFTGLIVLLFISSMMTSRWLQRWQKSDYLHSTHA